MKRIAALLACAACALPATAQVSGTVFGGARAGGGFTDTSSSADDRDVDVDSGGAGAVAIDWVIDPTRQIEVFVGRQSTDLRRVTVGTATETLPLDITYAHLGGTYYFDGGHAKGGPYVVGGLGITHFSPSLTDLSSEVRASMNVGIGWRLLLSPGISLRAELRGYATLVNSSGGFFCSGGCVVQIRGDSFTQGEAMVGLSIGY